MLTLSEELGNLRQADAHIAAARQRIESHRALAATLSEGAEKELADALLATMQATLVEFESHRDAIVANIARLRGQSHPGPHTTA